MIRFLTPVATLFFAASVAAAQLTPLTRAQALDLLAADAFATYALEVAADEPESLAARADSAMRMFAEQGRDND